MLKVLKNLKKSFWAVLIIVILLCIQAWADLELPDYTSRIVNNGIQSSGIEKPIPEILNKDSMELIKIFTSEEDYNKIIGNYTLLDKDKNVTNEQKELVKKYFGDNYNIEVNDIYVLNKLDKEKEEELTKIIVNPIMELAVLKTPEQSNEIKEKMLENVPEPQKSVMANMELIDIIKSMPKEQISQMLEQFNSQINEMPDSIKEQAVISSIKTVYVNMGVDTDKLQNNYIFMSGLQMLLVALISMVCAITIMLFSSRVAAKLGKNLREKIFKKVLSFSHSEFTEFSTASLITRSTNDIQQIQSLIAMMFRVLVYAPIMGIGAFGKVLVQSNNSMAWIIGVAILAIIFIIGTLFIIAMPRFKKLQLLIDRINQVSREILTGIPVIRAFHKEKHEEDRFEKANMDLRKTNTFISRAMSMMMPMLMFIMNATMILIIWVGGQNVDQGILQVGDMMAFIQYTMQILISFLFISMLSIMLPRASVAANRIVDVLETDPCIKDPKKAKEFDANKKGLVEFKNVSFRYPDADTEILEDITFTAKPGETTAIIGSTGSGKSTIINLIPRFYDVTEGELLVDGVNVKEIAQKDLRNIIGLVPQKGVLFSGTIESNIKYSDKNMEDEKMIEAAKIAQATEFIESKDEKYKSEIAQAGNNVSGGQKQRLAIARAIAKDPEIFIFDDSFSALDFKTDSKLREALGKKTSSKTVIIVAQRISTILNADQIIVLDEGKVVGIGKHEELMKDNETYRQIALSQLSEEELGGDA
ncbi:MAG: ATP-binding cassette domain-containing protein [Clostridia bacterium]|nr:ATP-binding cassette domain-containing protein [Clostridia bacterium]